METILQLSLLIWHFIKEFNVFSDKKIIFKTVIFIPV